jgi:hypothetical protein
MPSEEDSDEEQEVEQIEQIDFNVGEDEIAPIQQIKAKKTSKGRKINPWNVFMKDQKVQNGHTVNRSELRKRYKTFLEQKTAHNDGQNSTSIQREEGTPQKKKKTSHRNAASVYRSEVKTTSSTEPRSIEETAEMLTTLLSGLNKSYLSQSSFITLQPIVVSPDHIMRPAVFFLLSTLKQCLDGNESTEYWERCGVPVLNGLLQAL